MDIETHVAGTTYAYEGATQDVIRLRPGDALVLEREPGNANDRNAVRVYSKGRRVGYLPRTVAATVAPLIDGRRHVVEAVRSRDPAAIYNTRITVSVKEKDPLL